jgi:hypothetical protein
MDAGFTGMTKNSLVVVGLNFQDTRTYVIFALLFKSKRDLTPGLPVTTSDHLIRFPHTRVTAGLICTG